MAKPKQKRRAVRTPSAEIVLPQSLSDSQPSVSTSDKETKCETFCRIFKICLKRFITILFSHVGLTCVVIGYTILGGLIFKEIELPEEKLTRQTVKDTSAGYSEVIVDFFYNADQDKVLDRQFWDKEVGNILKDFEKEIYKLTKEKNWNGQFDGDQYQWSFAEALLYSVTVITTIGYGHITPKTIFGRLVTILYGSIGIPLTMLCLGNIGNLMAGFFRVLYRCACVKLTYQYIKFKRRRLRQRWVKRLQKKAHDMKDWAKRNHSIVSSVLKTGSRASIGSTDSPITFKRLPKQQTFPNRRHSESVVTYLNRDLVKEVKEIPRKHSLCVKDLRYPGSPLIKRLAGYDLQAIPENEIVESSPETPDSKRSSQSPHNSKATPSGASTLSSLSLRDFDDDERILKTRLKATRDLVPISMCLLLVTGYIILGAVIFTSWEENWDVLISFYFCFITLTTIGFGDFVPGMSRMNDDERTVFCTVYLFVGMALLAMSFHLIQEEVRHKFRKLAERIGLIEGKITKMLENYNTEE